MIDHRMHGAGAATAPDARPISRTHRNNHRNNCNNHRDPHHRAADEHRAAGELHAGIHRRRGSDAAPPPHGTLPGSGPRCLTADRFLPVPANQARRPLQPPLPQDLTVRRHASTTLDDGTPGYMPLSRTTDRVIRILLEGDLSRLRAESVAESTTLRTLMFGPMKSRPVSSRSRPPVPLREPPARPLATRQVPRR